MYLHIATRDFSRRLHQACINKSCQEAEFGLSELPHLGCQLYGAILMLIKLWNTFSGDILKTLSGHTEGVSDIAWAYDSERLASASDDKTVKLWDVTTVRMPVSCALLA